MSVSGDLDAVTSRVTQIQSNLSSLASSVPGGTGAFESVLARIDALSNGLGSSNPDPSDSGLASLSGGSGMLGSSGVSAASIDPGSGTSSSQQVTGSSVVAQAQQYLGVPYQWGGTNPSTGLDCSGLVQLVYGNLGMSLPRTSEQQASSGTAVASLAQAQPGDLLFYPGSDGSASSPGHVGIYIGNGQMIDAPYTGADVRVDPVGSPTAIRRIVGSQDGSPQNGSAVAASSVSTAALGSLGGYTNDFVQAGANHGVPATILAAVAKTESSMNPNAQSSAGAEGLMQLMPSTAASLGVNAWDPSQAIDGAARMLASAHQQFGSWSLALAAYNAGSGAVISHGGIPPYPETEAYVSKVLGLAGMAQGS